MMNNKSVNWACKCGKIWNLLVMDELIYLSNNPKGRKAGHCYCDTDLMRNWEKDKIKVNKKFYRDVSDKMLRRSRLHFLSTLNSKP